MTRVIVDFGLGNLRSIQNKIQRAGIETGISGDPAEIAGARLLILPGVGHFAAGMRNLEQRGLVSVLNDLVLVRKIPILGICLGMQLLTRSSEEGGVEGLGWIAARTRKFRFEGDGAPLKVPHVGWNRLDPRRETPLFDGVPGDQRFYFVHSYHVTCDDPADVLATTRYGYDFASVIQRENIFGTQFHPEKSHRSGMRILTNFLNMAEASIS